MPKGQQAVYTTGDRETCIRYVMDHYHGRVPDSGIPELQVKLGGKTPPSPQALRKWIRDWEQANLPPSAWKPKLISRKKAETSAESQPMTIPAPAKAFDFGEQDESPETAFDVASLTNLEQTKTAFDSTTKELARRAKGLPPKAWKSTPDNQLGKLAIDLQSVILREEKERLSQGMRDSAQDIERIIAACGILGVDPRKTFGDFADYVERKAVEFAGKTQLGRAQDPPTGELVISQTPETVSQ
jgi:hypothetical protein